MTYKENQWSPIINKHYVWDFVFSQWVTFVFMYIYIHICIHNKLWTDRENKCCCDGSLNISKRMLFQIINLKKDNGWTNNCYYACNHTAQTYSSYWLNLMIIYELLRNRPFDYAYQKKNYNILSTLHIMTMPEICIIFGYSICYNFSRQVPLLYY